MKVIRQGTDGIGGLYPRDTGRLKIVEGSILSTSTKIALLGDSTIDNGYWVQRRTSYTEKTDTVTHQLALALAKIADTSSYSIANFAVDGATTSDIMRHCFLNKVLREDEDHQSKLVNQLSAVCDWNADVVVISVGGNNYREALEKTLREKLDYLKLLGRVTPAAVKNDIKKAFSEVKEILLRQYKQVIDLLIEKNANLNRIVIMTQYYPSITEFTPYFIYTGFSHLARAENKNLDMFSTLEETINELSREILSYLNTKEKECLFIDLTSSMNPLGGNNTFQIEPNGKGAAIMGKLIAHAVSYSFTDPQKSKLALFRLDRDEKTIYLELLTDVSIRSFQVKSIRQFIGENKYKHVKLFFEPSKNVLLRYENAYHIITGKQFDPQYDGLPAFGLLDLNLINVLASYLWRQSLNDKLDSLTRVVTGGLSAPILLAKKALGLSMLVALGVPILGYHFAVNAFSKIAVDSDAEDNTAHQGNLIRT